MEWSGDHAKEGTVNPATVKYTDFLLATASGKVEGVKGLGKLATPLERTKVAAYTLGVVAPCMRLYAFVGKEFQGLLDSDGNHPYRKWIDNYSVESFQIKVQIRRHLMQELLHGFHEDSLGISPSVSVSSLMRASFT